MNTPKISVIIASHNNAEHIGECIDSILGRSFYDVEIIAVDCGSTDGTNDILYEISKEDNRLTFITDSMGSMGHAKNKAMHYVRAPYVLFAEADDYLEDECLDILYDYMEEDDSKSMAVFEMDSFGNDSLGMTNREIKTKISAANEMEQAACDREFRLFRWFVFDCRAIYCTSFLRDEDIRHYDMPGYGHQNAAFSYIALSKFKFSVMNIPLYYRRLDKGERIKASRAVFDICNEYRFLCQELKKASGIWQRNRHSFWNAYFYSNLIYYRKLSDDLKPLLSKRMQADIKKAIADGEFSYEHFDLLYKDELDALLEAAGRFDRIQREQERTRNSSQTQKNARDERFTRLLRADAEAEMDAFLKESASKRKQERLDKKWLTDEMSKDLASLRLLLGYSADEMGNILGISGSMYKSLESGKRKVSWDMYMALLFVFRYNDRTAAVTDSLGLYPEALKLRILKGIGIGY